MDGLFGVCVSVFVKPSVAFLCYYCVWFEWKHVWRICFRHVWSYKMHRTHHRNECTKIKLYPMAGWLFLFFVHFIRSYSQEVTRSRCKNHSKDSNKNWATMEVKWKINLASKWKFQMEHNQQNVAAIRAILSLKFMPMPIHIPFHHSNAICISVCLIYVRYLFYIARPFVLTYTRIFFHTFRQKTRRTKIFTFFFSVHVVVILLSNGVNCHVCDLYMNVDLLCVPYVSWRSVWSQ